jgi:hypothetical protein
VAIRYPFCWIGPSVGLRLVSVLIFSRCLNENIPKLFVRFQADINRRFMFTASAIRAMMISKHVWNIGQCTRLHSETPRRQPCSYLNSLWKINVWSCHYTWLIVHCENVWRT